MKRKLFTKADLKEIGLAFRKEVFLVFSIYALFLILRCGFEFLNRYVLHLY